jgi:hypothetical protein
MRTLRAHRGWFTAAVLIVLGALVSLIASPAASAAVQEHIAVGPSGSPTPTPSQPMMLASTGLDITVPVIVGLVALLLGTVMIGWAFLATGRRGRQH